MGLCVQVVGPFAEDGDVFGDYGANPDKKFVTTPLDGLKRLASNVQYAPGCKDNAVCTDYDGESVKTTVNGAEVIFVCLGTGKALDNLLYAVFLRTVCAQRGTATTC